MMKMCCIAHRCGMECMFEVMPFTANRAENSFGRIVDPFTFHYFIIFDITASRYRHIECISMEYSTATQAKTFIKKCSKSLSRLNFTPCKKTQHARLMVQHRKNELSLGFLVRSLFDEGKNLSPYA